MDQRPPEFTKRQVSGLLKSIITILVCVLLSFITGFTGAKIATMNTSSNGDGVTIVQQKGDKYKNTNLKGVSDVASKCGPSVVEIMTEYQSSSPNSFFSSNVSTGAGSGVIISEDGYVVTNNHVIDKATKIYVRTTDGQEYEATLIGTDAQTDIGVIKIEGQGFIPANFGDSDALEVGDAVVAIGNPLGELGGTVTTGIISALQREIIIENEQMTLLQTDAAINPGNSGGGLFDANGNLIGIVNAKESSTGIEGLGFAIPVNNIIDVIDELIKNGSVTSRPALNVSLYDYNAKSTYYYSNNDYKDGVYIVQIINGGAADKAGLEINDRIVTFDGKKISSSAEVKSILRKHKIGDSVEIVVERDEQEITKTVILQAPTTK